MLNQKIKFDMFTGIIEETGIIEFLQKGSRSSKIGVSASKILEDIKVGDSINTDGVCLTVTSVNNGHFTADIMPESMDRSSFAAMKTGTRVNLERAVRLSDRLGGHLVSGHIDCTGTILKTRKDENALWLTISSEKQGLRYIVEKGSVAIDGVSLTVTSVENSSFSVSIIPHTLSVTSFLFKRTGDVVNIEFDIIAKYVEKLANGNHLKGKVDMDFLAEQGFL
jgi:riboflavin synthase